VKIKDALNELEEEEVIDIAKKLEQFDPKFKKNWLINLIAELLTDPNRLTKRVFLSVRMELGEESISALLRYPYLQDIDEQLGDMLSEYGFFINGEMPEEVGLILKENGRTFAVKELSGVKDKVTPSLFLKFLLVLGLLKKEKEIDYKGKKFDNKIDEMIKRLYLNHQDKYVFRDFINYMIRIDLMERKTDRKNNKVILKEQAVKEWEGQDALTIMKNFYYSGWERKDVFDFLENIALFQHKLTEWIDIDYLPKFIDEDRKAEKMGLVRTTEKDGKHYVQLNPEGWFLMKGEYPPIWYEKTLIVSADSEIFIPHMMDPFIAYTLLQFGSLKDNGYFIVLDIDSFDCESVNKRKYRVLYQMLSRKSRFLPDVLRYELEEVIS
jgi:hypothetical protein